MGYPITKNYDGKTWITGHASGSGTDGVEGSITFDPSDYDQSLIGDPEKQVKGLYIDDSGNIHEGETGTVIPPDPDTAYADIEQLLIDAFEADGSSTPELDAMELINRYPAVVKALERENYGRVSAFLNKKIKPNEAVVDDSLETDINGVLKV